jgi:hypothetical protein
MNMEESERKFVMDELIPMPFASLERSLKAYLGKLSQAKRHSWISLLTIAIFSYISSSRHRN